MVAGVGGIGGGGDTKKPLQPKPVQNNLPPRVIAPPPPPFLPLPCVLLAKSHIFSFPLPAQTPFGGPSFPTGSLGITCYTRICKTNQVWKGHRVPALQSGCHHSCRSFPAGTRGVGVQVTPHNSVLVASPWDCGATEALATENATGWHVPAASGSLAF